MYRRDVLIIIIIILLKYKQKGKGEGKGPPTGRIMLSSDQTMKRVELQFTVVLLYKLPYQTHIIYPAALYHKSYMVHGHGPRQSILILKLRGL